MTANDYRFEDLLVALRRITSTNMSETELAAEAAAELTKLLKDPNAIAEEFRQTVTLGSPTGYMLHRDPRKKFNVTSVIWGPGSSLEPHNHNTWGVVGVLKNLIEESRYDEVDGVLTQREVNHQVAGATSLLFPGDEVHAMHNPTDKTTVEIHIYGDDLVGLPRLRWVNLDQPIEFISPKYSNC